MCCRQQFLSWLNFFICVSNTSMRFSIIAFVQRKKTSHFLIQQITLLKKIWISMRHFYVWTMNICLLIVMMLKVITISFSLFWISYIFICWSSSGKSFQCIQLNPQRLLHWWPRSTVYCMHCQQDVSPYSGNHFTKIQL